MKCKCFNFLGFRKDQLLSKPIVALIVLMSLFSLSNAQITVNGGGSYATIQAAINAAASGDVIDVPPGIYTEELSIVSKSLTLNGANAAIPAGNAPGVRGAESEIIGRMLVSGNTFDLTVSGFTLRPNTNSQCIVLYCITVMPEPMC